MVDFTISSSDFNLCLRAASEAAISLGSMKTTLLHKLLSSSVRMGALLFAVIGTATLTHAGTVLSAVGPTPPGESDKVSCGYLKVYSATQESQWGEGSYY